MTLSRTNLLGQISSGQFGTGNFTSTAFTPANSSLLVVGVAYVENSGSTTDPTTALTISGGSLTWTQQATAVAAPTAFPSLVKIWTAPVATGASMSVVLSTSGRSAGLYGVSVVCYTGYNTGTPVGGTASGQQNGGFGSAPNAVSLTLSAAPAAGDETFGFVFADKSTSDITPGSAFTEIDDLYNSNWGSAESEIRTGSTSTTVDWVDLRPAGGSLFNFAAVAIVVKAAGGGSVSGDAALAVTATLSAGEVTIHPVGAALAATATMAATATKLTLPASALAVTATLTGAATDTILPAAGLAVTATLGADTALTKPVAAALAVTATLAAAATTGAAPKTADAALSVTVTLAVAGARTALPTATLAVTATLTTNGFLVRQVGAALAVIAALAADASDVSANGPSAPRPRIRTTTRIPALATTGYDRPLRTDTRGG